MTCCWVVHSLLASLAFALALDLDPSPTITPVFRSGSEGYHTFRIPSVIATPKGMLLAFCEGRKSGRGDSGDIDLILKRSEDQGRSWSPARVLFDVGPDTIGNPCPVVDQSTGIVWLTLTRNRGDDSESEIVSGESQGTRTVWVSGTSDEGATWSALREITAEVKPQEWTWYATGPGVGIQLRTGRLVIPCDHKVRGTKSTGAHVIYSDDHGKSWTRGGAIGPGTNECQVVERVYGSLLLNMRNHPAGETNHRKLAVSPDGGRTWGPLTEDRALIEPGCQAGLIRVSPGLLVFTNPASSRRQRLTVRWSRDDGRTWSGSQVLHPGPSAYSCPVVLANDRLGCLYEAGETGPYETIWFASFTRAE